MSYRTSLRKFIDSTALMALPTLRAWLNGNAKFYDYVSEAKPLCFSLYSQMFDDVERC